MEEAFLVCDECVRRRVGVTSTGVKIYIGLSYQMVSSELAEVENTNINGMMSLQNHTAV